MEENIPQEVPQEAPTPPKKKSKLIIIIVIIALLIGIAAAAYIFLFKQTGPGYLADKLEVSVEIEDQQEMYELGDIISLNLNIKNPLSKSIEHTSGYSNSDPSIFTEEIPDQYHMKMSSPGSETVIFAPGETKTTNFKMDVLVQERL